MKNRRWIAAFAAVVTVLFASPALALSTDRASEDSAGQGGTGTSDHVALSDDGQLAAFISDAEDLVPGDTNGVSDVFVKDLDSGDMTRVSVASDGTEGNDQSGGFESVDISGNGRFVTFASEASNLVGGDSNGFQDVFVHDLENGDTELVSSTPAGGQYNANSSNPAISDDGRFVAFLASTSSYAAVHDRQAATTEYLLWDHPFNFTGTWIDISDDGRFVAIATNDMNDNSAYVRFDRDSNTWERADTRMSGDSETRLNWISISGNGRYVAYSSVDENIVSGDSDGLVDVFVWDGQSDSIELIEGDAFTGGEALEVRPSLSDNGRFISFVPGATNDPYGTGTPHYEIFRYDRSSDDAVRVSEFDDGSALGTHAWHPAISGNGRYIGFDTTAAIDSDDTLGYHDVYIVDVEGADEPDPEPDVCDGIFDDTEGNTFEQDICWLAQEEITKGCNPPANTLFCPDDEVTRGQMAAFLNRYFDLPGTSTDHFVDDDGTTFEGDINRLAEAGVTKGCNPPANDEFCSDENVSREQMAAFLVRAFDLTADDHPGFDDVPDSNTFVDDIGKLATAGITRGCNPPANSSYCPDDDVTRGQMAAFLRRADN